MKYLFIVFGIMVLFALTNVSALPSVAYNRIYVDLNTSYPFILQPNDNFVYNISLYTNGSQFNFTWTGTEYTLDLLFTEEGDYPFVINSSEVSGDITGILLVRQPFDVTFKFFKEKRQFLFFSNKYINNVAYVTAEYSQNLTYPELERFMTPLKSSQFRQRVFHAPYQDGTATLKMYDRNRYYGIRIIDGVISYDSIYAIPNVSESYGINAYVGNYYLNGSDTTFNVYLPNKTLMPYRWLMNWVLLFLIFASLGIALILLFVVSDHPALAFAFGIIAPLFLLFIRGVLWLTTGN